MEETKNGEYYLQLSDSDRAELERFTRWSISKEWAEFWVQKPGTAVYRPSKELYENHLGLEWSLKFGATGGHTIFYRSFSQTAASGGENYNWLQDVKVLKVYDNGDREQGTAYIGARKYASLPDQEAKPRREYKFLEESDESRRMREAEEKERNDRSTLFVFPNYGDYGYGIFLLDEKSRAYVLKNIQNERDPFLRSMMWGALWDSVREGELDPREYVELVLNVLMQKPVRAGGRNEQRTDTALADARASALEDESTTALLLNRVVTAMNYYIDDSRSAGLRPRAEDLLIERMRNAETLGQRITYYRAFLNIAASENARRVLKEMLKGGEDVSRKDAKPQSGQAIPLKTKDKFDIVTRLLILGDPDAERLLAELEKTETGDDAKRYAYAARAGIATAENKAKYWNDFVNNKEISESWIEAAFGPWNSIRHSELTLPYLERALKELPNHKRSRKIFFVNGWLGAFIGGQRSEAALNIVNKFLADNPTLDRDLRLKILENADIIERAVKIRKLATN
ncbi:MAG: ERAP1-like C-terminal domain-containing protein [Pyrinomonadaceae bacterium]|nr:ERAP1-like C-terminal domain-containing protein [Pyrinomonadaceae bacterium]